MKLLLRNSAALILCIIALYGYVQAPRALRWNVLHVFAAQVQHDNLFMLVCLQVHS